MTGSSHKRRHNVDQKFVRQELVKGWVVVVAQVVAILLALAYGVTALVEAHASTLQVTVGKSVASLAFALVATAAGERQRRRRH